MKPRGSSVVVKGGIVVLACVLLLSAGLLYLNSGDAPPETRIELVAARRGAVASVVSAAGTTVDANTRELAFGADGAVRRVYVKVGDKVTAGQHLARIDDTSARERYEEAKARLAAAEETLENVRNGESGGGANAQAASYVLSGYVARPEPVATVTVTATPQPAVTVTKTVPGPQQTVTVTPPQPTQTVTVTATPTAAPTATVTVTAAPTVTVTATPRVVPTVTVTAAPTVTVTAAPGAAPTPAGTYDGPWFGGASPSASAPGGSPGDGGSGAPSASPSGRPSAACPTGAAGSGGGASPGASSAASPGASAKPSAVPSASGGAGAAGSCPSGQPGQGRDQGRGRPGGDGSGGGSGRGGFGSGGGGNRAGGGQATTEAQAEAAVTQAKNDLEEAKEALAGVVIKAPVSGTILSVAGAAGDEVTAGRTFIRLGRLDELQVKAMVTQSDVEKLKIGQKASVTLATRAGRNYPGRVAHIDPMATTSGDLVRYGVLIAFDRRPANLLLGQNATITVTTEESADAVHIPAQAARLRGDGTAVVTVQGGDGRTAERTVRTGVRGDQYIEIVDGLQEGDRVVLPGSAASGEFPDGSFPGLAASPSGTPS